MSESDQHIDTLADRAKQAAARVHASTSATKDKLQAQVMQARAAADRTSGELRAKAAGSKSETAQGWSAVRESWQDHVAEIQSRVDTQKQEHDVHRAERRADRAEDNALEAIDFAYLAIEDAEWAVLDAVLARAEARELAATPV